MWGSQLWRYLLQPLCRKDASALPALLSTATPEVARSVVGGVIWCVEEASSGGRPTSLRPRAAHDEGSRQLSGRSRSVEGQPLYDSLQGSGPLLAEGRTPSLTKGLIAWFGASTFGVASLILLGGVTRLTRSGLSMTDWKFTGERPPWTQDEWEAEFGKYRQSPEFRRVNLSICLDEFKFIYWMEYAHRMWGRCLGILFGLPAVYFLARGAVTPALGKRLVLLFVMGGTQGLVGWWMVRSGLEEPAEETAIPRVSPYRLAAHLTSAFAIYSLLLWTTLSLRIPQALLKTAPVHIQRSRKSVRGWVTALSGLIGLTAVSGAFVAGNDAGRSFNTFPRMGEDWIPEAYFSEQLLSATHFFENTASVQLHHRLLALATGVSSLALVYKTRRMDLPPSTRRSLTAVAGMAVGQITLGILTLLHCVPTLLGSAHQAGALVLFSLALNTLHTLRSAQPTQFASVLSRSVPSMTALLVVGVGLCVVFEKQSKWRDA